MGQERRPAPTGSGWWTPIGNAESTPSALELVANAAECGGDVERALAELPGPTEQAFAASADLNYRWSVLASLGAADLTAARVVEPHIDAVTILEESGRTLAQTAPGSWGVYAAEGADPALAAAEEGGLWVLNGVKPWCSLADHVDNALVTAWTGPGTRRLFAVNMGGGTVEVSDDPWFARGLAGIRSPRVTFDATPAEPVGEDGWYLNRPGFAVGGIRVAAVWYGAAVAVGRTLRRLSTDREIDQIAAMHLGAVEGSLHRAACVLDDAARELSHDGTDAIRATALALHVRSTVRIASEEVLERAAHALGPAPLVRDRAHAARVADLELYLRQEHAERDLAILGRHVLQHGGKVI
ncbi:acyl-CoA dehydrogenase [Gordonia iterans]